MTLLLSVAGRVVGCDTVTKYSGRVVGCGTVTKCTWRVVGCGTVTKCCSEGSWVWLSIVGV